MRGFCAAAFALGVLVEIAVLPVLGAPSNYLVHSPAITVELSRDGEVVGAVFGKANVRWPLSGQTLLAGCHVVGEVSSEQGNDGGVRFKKKLACNASGARKEVQLTESFLPTKNSVRWDMELEGQGLPWSTPIETRLHFANAEGAKFWTAWGDPRPDDDWVRTGSWWTVRTKMDVALVGGGDTGGWEDPLTTTPFRDRKFWYGAPYYQYDDPRIYYMPFYRDVFCIPLATVIDENRDIGMSLVLSPEDVLQDMTLETSADGDVAFSRLFRRISKGSPVHFSMDLVAHEGDWRGGLRWMSTRYEEYFNPPLPKADELGGTAAYSSYEGDLDVAKFKRMAFTVNWRASFAYPYQGMFIPPVPDNQEWARGYEFSENPPFDLGPTTSIPKMAAYSRKMRQMGFYVLDYFNLSEFGKDIVYPSSTSMSETDPNLWRDPNDFLYARLQDAILFHSPREKPASAAGAPPAEGSPIRAASRNVVLDWGQPSWQNFLLEQANRLIQKIPDSSGIAIDRMDWIRYYNFRADDGVSWYDGPVRYLALSWIDMLGKLGPLEHSAGRVIFANPHVKRIDVLRQVDGLFDESDTLGPSKNTTALLGMFKPTIGWVFGEQDIKPDPDTFIQRFLYLGVFPMAPFPQNDHSPLPSSSLDRLYLDYGPLFESMRGRKWVLLPHAVSVKNDVAKANMFKVPAGYVIPITFGGTAKTVDVTVKNLSDLFSSSAGIQCEVINPGDGHWNACNFDKDGTQVTIHAFLGRGCAMLRLRTGANLHSSLKQSKNRPN